MKRRLEDLTYEEYVKRGMKLKEILTAESSAYGIEALMRPTDSLPFHLPHSRVFYNESIEIEHNIQNMEKIHVPDLSLSDLYKKRPLTKKKLSDLLEPNKRFTKQNEIDDEKHLGTIVKLPPLTKPKVKKIQVQIPKKGLGYLKKFPIEHLGDNGRIHFMKLLEIVENLKTDQNYYLKHYLPKEARNSSPFDFRVVPFCEVNPQNFYTICKKGMFHTRFGVVTFTSIKELKMIYTNFVMMRKLKFFKDFLLIKIFRQWKKDVWMKRWQSRKYDLESTYLFKRISLKNVIFDVRNLCYSLAQMSFFDDSVIEKLNLKDFKKKQDIKVKKIFDKLKESQELIKALLKAACEEELVESGHYLPEGYYDRYGGNLKSKKMVLKKRDLKQEIIKEHDKKKQCIKIARAIKFVDYLLLDMLHNLILNSLDHMLSTFKKHVCYLNDASYYVSEDVDIVTGKERKAPPWFPMFFIDLQPTDDFETLSFIPPPSDWKILFNGIVDLWTKTVQNVKPLLNDEVFSPFTCPVTNDLPEYQILGPAPKLCDILEGDFILNDKKRLINYVIDNNIHIIHLYLGRLHTPFCYYKVNCNVTRDELKQERDIAHLRKWLHESIFQVDIVKRILPEQHIGLFFLTTENFQDMILPVAVKINSAIKEIIPEIANEKIMEILNEAQEALDYLDRYPKTSLQFTKYLEAIEQIAARGQEFDEIADYIMKLHELCEDYNVPVPEEDIDQYYEMVDLTVVLQKKADSLRNNTDEIIGHFRAAIRNDEAGLSAKVSQILADVQSPIFFNPQSDPLDIEFVLHELNERIQECIQQANLFRSFQRACKDQVSRFEAVDEALNQINLRQLLWENVVQWEDQTSIWLNGDFEQLNPEEMQQIIAKFLKNVIQFEKNFPPNSIVSELRQKVERMRDKVPFITNLRNPNIKPRHWLKLEQILNHKFDPAARKSLKLLEDIGIYEHQDAILDISAAASSESSLEGLLKKIEDAWKALLFTLVPHKDATDVFILSALDEVNVILDETHINLSTIASSRSVGPIKPRVDDWTKKMDLFSRTLEEWTNCQTNWLYLEPIFSAPDIQRQLPTEAKMFLVVDKSWKAIMRNTSKNPLALRAATVPGLLEEFERNNALLEEILKCLEAYLESKRVIFPRFYFLSNEELLEILAQTRNPHAVQPHLRKCFDAINKLGFGQKAVMPDGSEKTLDDAASAPPGAKIVMTTDIISMISPEGEIIKLQKGLKARGNVEDWLGKVENAMFTALYRLMKYGIDDYEGKKRTTWVLLHASQIVLTVSQIMWSRSVHERMEEKDPFSAIMDFERKCFQDLNDLASMVRGKLEKVHRSTLCALITIDVHARDIITSLVNYKVGSSNNFEWVKQLRYYWDNDIDNCIACMAIARHVYGYEYLGVSPRLVVTPLTDKCYLCLMGALQLDLGGAPAGPAGTGKTETTKDLAKALAIQCVVFNCSDGLDYKMMGRFFSGLAQSGAWCCFDEFNRIDIEVLSVIAQQLITIRNAKAAKLSRFMFEGREIKLIPQCATFITMNPGYAGRTELPDNLKSVFRPFAMMVPDYGLIAEVILYSEGFESSKGLAQKMVNMYKLCSEQLSQQDHYDFGMRAVKSVLVMAGSLKRENPDKREDIVLIRALRDSNLPKFLADDAVLFKGILNDLFPGVVLPEHDYGAFQLAMNYVVEKRGLQPVPCTFTKTIQLYETMVVRHGVMTVGPTGGGKTTILNVLKGTLAKLHEDEVEGPYFRPVTIYTLNPKSVTMGELYGEVNLSTMEWRDGLLGIFVRKAVRCTEEIHQWVVCDGPVDAVWIENLNTVLDDNKMLCLANSERIKLTAWVHMVFEVQDLAQASPATVSRCGMVYVDPNELKWLPYVTTWAKTLLAKRHLNEDSYEYLLSVFKLFLEDGLQFVRKHCGVGIHQVESSKVAMLCSLLQNILKTPKLFGSKATNADIARGILQIFAVAYIWSVGGNILENARGPFESFVRSQFERFEDVKVPFDKTFWDVFYSPEQKALIGWSSITPDFKYNPDVQFFDMLVPTSDTVCFGYFMQRLLDENHPVFFTGTTGVGKSVIAKEVLNALSDSKKWVVNVLNFSAQTSSYRTQEMIELKLEKKRRTLMGAPFGKRIAVFVDDVNMPKLETYGAQAPIELLRQFLDFKGLYDREKLFWKDIEGMVLCCACAPPGGGRNPITPRFVRHFGMLLIPAPSDASLKLIFTSILRGYLQDFALPILATSDYIVNSAVELYKRIAEDLLPTPAKSHYVFNLRDLSKCIQGVLQANSTVVCEKEDIFRLFFHECMRVFHDRLINIEDKSYFIYLLRDICAKYLHSTVIDLPTESGLIKKPPILFFGDFLNTTVEKKDRIYEEIKDISKLKTALQDALVDYNLVKSTDMKLIFFMDAIEHVCRLARILRAERGNGLLVGVGGMGKQSLTKLGSHVNLCSCFQIELTRTYDYNAFHEDLRKLYFKAGGLAQDMVFLFNDTQIVMEEFLEDINNILNSGEVPNLFEGDELEKCIIACRPAAKALGIPESNRDAIFDFFISRVRSCLHVVLCMSPVGDAFRRRCRMFPSLVNCCTIDWFMPWPEEALISVAKDSLKEFIDAKLVDSMSLICFTMHSSVEEASFRFYNEMKRHYYVTPSSYLDLLKLYASMLESRKEHIKSTKDRINNGLMKLFETNDLVASMKVQLVKLEPALAAKNVETAKLMKVLVAEKAAADEVRTVVLGDEALAKEKAAECQVLKDDAQADLDLALPAMEAAVKALEALNKSDINEVKVFNKPPYLVKFVMEAVCLLLGAKQDWASAKVVLGDTNFLKKLQDYDKDNISDSLLKKLKKYIEDPQFVPELIAATSKACKSLCLWVRAIDTYAKVYRVVEPKRQKLLAAESELNSIMAILREKQAKLADVEAQIARLEASYDASLKEKGKLEATLELCSARMNRAGRLTSALADEQERWETGVKTLSGEYKNLVGDVLVAAACVAYLGAFTNNYRDELSELWLSQIRKFQIPASQTFSLIHILADPYEIRVWNTCGLPGDKVSIENGIYVTRASRWPLMIDPQEQANRWIRQMEADNNLRIVKLTDPNFMRALETCIRLGMPMLIWEVGEQLDPTLRPVLTKSVFVAAGRQLIRLGDADVDYNENFRLYVTTKLSNPHYLPEICIQVTLVNFTVTPSGLEDQLLAEVVRIERPDLEKQRTELIVRINKDKGQLYAIEDKILRMLFNSTGNILDDEELVETLNESKETSAVITIRLEETEETEAKITVAREGYRTVAERGSVLYFVVAQLAEIDPMYQFSLKYFKMIFNNVIETIPPSPTLEERLQTLMKEITLAIYNNISRGLFEKDKLVYSFMLCTSIYIKSGTIRESHWLFLLRGAVGNIKSSATKPDIPAVTEMIWNSCSFLEQLDRSFDGLAKHVATKIPVSVGDYNLEIALGGKQSPKCPINWNVRLDLFKRIMMIKALKEEKSLTSKSIITPPICISNFPKGKSAIEVVLIMLFQQISSNVHQLDDKDEVIFAVTEYVKVMLGKAFVESPLISLHVLYADTNNITPLVFVLSTGSDPVGAFLRFAAETNNTSRINSISLGQGQGPIAYNMIERGKHKGDWVFLQNCHLASSWMLTLEKIVMDISDNPKDVHSEFRLFMSSMPSKAFPVSVLQNSVKVTNEPPKGLRSNVKRAFTEIQEDFFENNPLSGNWRKMIFGICFFHAVILERKKFGPLGWNILYEFSDSDRECALLNLSLFCSKEKKGRIPWDALQYITGEITYGGRVTDAWDQRTLKTILKKFFSPVTLEAGYNYSDSGTYYAPESEQIFRLVHYQEFIENLPLIEEPEIFGMHENANIAFQTKETGNILNTIMSVEVKESGGTEGKSSDDLVFELADNIKSKIASKISTDNVYPDHIVRDEKDRLPSLTTVLFQEVDRFNKMLKIIHTSIDNLKKAIKGLVVMSDDLEEVYKAFMNNMIPKMWSARSYPSLKSLGSWTKDLVLRIDFIHCWLTMGQPPSFWISGFFFPQGFMTGVLQTYARKYDFPIDELKVDFAVKKVTLNQEDIEEYHRTAKDDNRVAYKNIQLPEEGVLVHGLFLDAARFDTSNMILADPNPGELNPPLPVLWLVPSGKIPSAENRYLCPLYKTSVRAGVLSTTGHSTNFVIAVLLPTDKEQNYWILKGTALLTQITD